MNTITLRTMATLRIMAPALALLGCLTTASAAFAEDRHAGYYYPAPMTQEEYKARSITLDGMDRGTRINFVNDMTAQMLAGPYPPQFAIFAKGNDAEKLIIVSLYDNAFNTLFRARALLAMLTAVTRRSPYFQETGVEDLFTFFDFLVLMGFTRLTISDGKTFAHQVKFI